MRYQAALSFALLLYCSSLHSPTAAKVDQRHFSFPTAYSIGSLQLMGNENVSTESVGRSIGSAQGSVSVVVPPGSTVLLELNPRCMEHPELFKNVQTAGINRLKLAYLSMDDNDHSTCDKALQSLPQFKDLISLNVERSDTTDKGLSGFKSLSSVKYMTAFGAAIDGSIFKEAQKLKNLERFNLLFNPLKGENLKYLGALPNLKQLMLSQDYLSDDDMKYFPKCPQLRRLDLQGNSKLTDSSLPALRQQTALEYLDIRATKISFEGLLTLRNLKLTQLILTIRRYRPNEVEEMKKAFPKAILDYRGTNLPKDDQILFSPLK
jgi:hypothetical protein